MRNKIYTLLNNNYNKYHTITYNIYICKID